MTDLQLVAAAFAVSAVLAYLLLRRRAARASAPAAPASAAGAVEKAPASGAPAAVPRPPESVPFALATEEGAVVIVDAPTSSSGAPRALPKIAYEEDADADLTVVGSQEQKRPSYSPPTQKIVYDEEAAADEPTHAGALILVTATAQTDRGVRRKRNEDSVLAREDQGIFVVADGMGGYRGGEVASQLAVTTIERAFSTKTFDGPEHDTIPPRASELARAIQMANEAIFQKACGDDQLEGMGTTISAARFSPNKQRVYIGHVGDSRVYLFRKGKLRQMTSDHTMRELGIEGEGAAHLSRAVGIWPVVPIDIVLGKPQPDDVYLLCSDGLSKMVDDETIESVLAACTTPSDAAEALVRVANERGGKDNVSVIVVRVDDATKSLDPRVAA